MCQTCDDVRANLDGESPKELIVRIAVEIEKRADAGGPLNSSGYKRVKMLTEAHFESLIDELLDTELQPRNTEVETVFERRMRGGG